MALSIYEPKPGSYQVFGAVILFVGWKHFLEYVQGTKRTSLIALCLLAPCMCMAMRIAVLFNEGIGGEFILGLGILISGIIAFGFRNMGVEVSRIAFKRIWLIIIPLIGIVTINVVGTPLEALHLSRLSQQEVQIIAITIFWEEVLFRGIFFGFWQYKYGLRSTKSCLTILLISSIVFGAMHFGQPPIHFFLRSGLGLMFGMVRLQTQTIMYGLGLHALNNGLSVVMGGNTSDAIKVIIFIVLIAISLSIVGVQRKPDQLQQSDKPLGGIA